MSDDVLHGLIVITEGGHICRPLIDNDLHARAHAHREHGRAKSGEKTSS